MAGRRNADRADRSPGRFDVDARLTEISAKGEGLERGAALVDFEMFRLSLLSPVPGKSGFVRKLEK